MSRPPFPLPFSSGRALLLLGMAALAAPSSARAQSPVASTYATRDGRIVSYVLACAATDGTFTAMPCGVAGYPVHVTIDGGSAGGGGGTPTTGPGTASTALVGVQGGGSGALPVSVSQGGAWSVTVGNLPATQPVSAVSLPLPAGAATASGQIPRSATITPTTVSVSTADTAVLAPGAATTRLDVFNVAGSGTVWLTPLGGAVTTAAVGTGYPIPPGGGYSFPGVAVPANGFHAVSSSGTNTVTVWAGN